MTDVLGAVESKSVSEPVVLIVEDLANQRMEKAREMVERGCVPIAVEGTDAAARELTASPGIDLVLTDIHLVPRRSGDKSGVELARFVRTDHPDIPIVGYSAYFAEDELPDEDLELFDFAYGKGQSTFSEIEGNMDRCGELAFKSRLQRKNRAEELLADPPRDQSELVLEIVRSASLAEVEGVEQILHKAGFRLKLVTIPSSANPKPLIVWVREQDNCVDVEVYGHSGLYVTGESEEEAFAHLIDLIQLYWQDLDARDEELSGPAKKLYDFLADLRLADDQGSS
ncbi:MAG TPA: hypothetical protein VIT89_06055 [Solirubrobacterales bacterium]